MTKMRKKSDFGWGGDAYPAQEPQDVQLQKDQEQFYRMNDARAESYSWVVSGKNILVVSKDKLDDVFSALGITQNHHGPVAIGTVSLSHRWSANFVVEESNIDLDTLSKIFERWAKDPNSTLDFKEIDHNFFIASVVDKNGIPLPVKTNYTKNKKAGVDKIALIEPNGGGAGSGWQTVPKTWNRTDKDLRTDIQIQDNDRGKLPGQGDMRADSGGELTTYIYQCPECLEVFESGNLLREHLVFDHERQPPTGNEYEIRNNDETFYPDNEAVYENDGGIHTGAVIPGPIPFSYNVETDRIYVGEPGDERVKLDSTNPFGVVEGYYTPDGDILIVNRPMIQYAIKYFIILWNEIHPELEVKKVYILRKENGRKIKERVAHA